MPILRAADRGQADHGWLDARHSFSFAGYHNPERMGYRALRVLNEDRIAPGGGFGRHPHRDMEILTYIIAGELAHRDSMDNTRTIGPGQIQRMSAGTGIMHSEFNASQTEPVHLIQIWLLPDAPGHAPSYEELDLGPAGAHNTLRLIASPDPDDGATTWHQDARLHAAKWEAGHTRTFELPAGRHGWLQVISGPLAAGTETLHAGDALEFSGPLALDLTAEQASEFLVFDLA